MSILLLWLTLTLLSNCTRTCANFYKSFSSQCITPPICKNLPLSLSLSLSLHSALCEYFLLAKLSQSCSAMRTPRSEHESKQTRTVCVCVLCVCEVGRGRVPRKKNTTIESWVVSSQPNHIYDSRPSLFLLSLFMFLCLSLPRSPFLFAVLWFNCRGQRTYGQWAAARKCYIFFFFFLQYSRSSKWEVNKHPQWGTNTVLILPKLYYINTPCLSLPSLPHLLSNKDMGGFLLHYPYPAEVSFHVLPGPVVCQAARCQARLCLPTHPASCRLLNNAICRSPLTTPAPFMVSGKTRNAVKYFRRRYTIARKAQ